MKYVALLDNGRVIEIGRPDPYIYIPHLLPAKIGFTIEENKMNTVITKRTFQLKEEAIDGDTWMGKYEEIL
jgi:hypothetical protein